MATIVYSAQESGFLPGFVYRNPNYFSAPLGKPEKIIIVGNWPHIRAAYEAIGTEVEVVSAAEWIRAEGELPPPEPKGQSEPDPGDAPRVGKGPGGRWYIRSGNKNLCGPYDTEEAANDAFAAGAHLSPKED